MSSNTNINDTTTSVSGGSTNNLQNNNNNNNLNNNNTNTNLNQNYQNQQQSLQDLQQQQQSNTQQQIPIIEVPETIQRGSGTTFGISLAPPLQGESQQSPSQKSNNQQSISQTDKSTLQEVQELLQIIKSKQGLKSLLEIGMDQKQPQQEQQQAQNTTSSDTMGKVLVPSFNLDDYKGSKTHVFDFLQYLQRQKSLLLSLNIPEVQKKILLNSKLPSYVSNNMLTVVDDTTISLSEYIRQVVNFYGPKKEQLRSQLMNSSPTKFENYVSFIHKMQELASFAEVKESQLLFILECRLPKHISGYIKDCNTIAQYVDKINIVQQEGWFSLIDDQFRKTIPQPNYGKNKEASQKEQPVNQSSGFSSRDNQGEAGQNSGVKNGVAFFGIENSFENYPVQTRGVKKQQHIDTQLPKSFQNQAQRDYEQFQQQQTQARQRQQQQQHQQQQQQAYEQQQQQQQLKNQQFNQNQTGTSAQHFQNGQDTSPTQAQQTQSQQNSGQQQQGTAPQVDPSLQKLFEKAKQNFAQQQQQQQQNNISNNLPQINKGVRGKRPNLQQYFEPETYTKALTLDPIRYTNQAQQFNLTQAMKDIFVPVTFGQYLNLTGFEIQKKQNQQIPNNVAYYQANNPVYSVESQSQQNAVVPTVSQNVYNSQEYSEDSQNSQNFEQAIYEYFYKAQQHNQDTIAQELTNVESLKLSDSNEHLCIPVVINQVQVSGITDSGAQQTIISLKTVEQAGITHLIKKQIDSTQSIHVYGCTGKDKILGIIPRLDVVIQGFEVAWQDVFVQQNSPFDLLIGLDMLALFDFQFEIKNRIVSFIPYPNDPRVILKLCDSTNPVQNQNNIKYAMVSYLQIDPTVNTQEYNVATHFDQIYKLYPEFPIYQQYNLIYIDPAWYYKKPIFQKSPPYPCLTFKQLQLLPLQAIKNSKGCIILLWSTGTHLTQSMHLIDYWGFKYINLFLIWRKVKKYKLEAASGQGIYSRNVYEFLLMGTSGKVGQFRIKQSKESTISQEIQSIIEINQPRSKIFSRKPYEVYKSISKVFDLNQMKNIEIFATERNEHNSKFDLYGNQLQPYFQKSQAFLKYPKTFYSTLHQQQKRLYTNTKISNIITQCYIQSQDYINTYCENLNIGPNVPIEYIQKLKALIKKYSTVYKFDNSLTYTNITEADVELKPNTKPIKMKPYKCVGESYKFLKQKFESMEKDGLVIKGKSEWGTAVMTVPKDSLTEPFRAVQNFKRVNNVTKKDIYPLRRIEFILVKVNKKRWKVVVDLRGGFNQIKRTLKSMEIMAMILPFGLFLPVVMWFGETNAPSIFQRAIDIAISDLYDNGVECYIDDIIVYADTLSELLFILEQLFIRLQRANFKLHPDKCIYFVETATILGHEISYDTMSPKSKKIQKLSNIEIPNTKKQLQQLMGSINYYRKFIPDLAMLLLPFQKTLMSQDKFLWSQEQQLSFDTIMQYLHTKMILQLPDLNKQFKVIISYTPYTYNTALIQCQNNDQEFVCGFHSQHQVMNSSTLDMYLREIDCLCWALNEWRPYISHQQFIVQTDLRALKHLYQAQTHNLKLLDYQLELQDLIFDIESIPINRMRQMLLLTSFRNNDNSIKEIESSYYQIQQSQSIDPKQSNKKSIDNKGSNFSNYTYILQFDGACQKFQFNNQIGAGAYVVFDSHRNILHDASFKFSGSQTNNCAEYSALIEGLKYCILKGFNKHKILVQGDSQLIIRQVTYQYMCNSDTLSLFCQQARELLKNFKNITIEHIDRKYNFECDNRAKKVLSQLKEKSIKVVQNYYADLGLEIDLIKCQICDNTQPEETMMLCDHCNQGYHCHCINLENIIERDWYCEQCYEIIQEKNNTGSFVDPCEDLYLLQFLRNQMSYQQFNQLFVEIQQRIIQRAKIYTIVQERLFKVGLDESLREVPTIAERRTLVEQVHQLIGHLGINRTTALIQEYYYWPKMQIQITDQLRHCMLCNAQNPQYLHMPGVFPINKKFGPMQCLYFDCFYLPKSKRGNNLVVMAICGMTKWVEAKAIPTNNSKFTRDFLFDEIICRYGCPLTIRSDNGPEFLGNFKDLCDNMGIIQFFSSPYYPQSNGQIERMNRTVKNCITKLANSFTSHAHYDWEDYLPQALMGIRFTVSRPTAYSPFQALFGQDPVLPGYQAINQGVTFMFPNDTEQSDYIYNKIVFKQNIQPEIYQNLQHMESEIEQVIRKRETISSNSLEYGQLVFVKRENPVIYPNTKSKGPYVFLGYNDPERTSAILMNPQNSKLRYVNITKINPLRFY